MGKNNPDIDSITIHQQQYIETIYSLCQKGEHSHAHSKDIAENLNVKMPSVTEALRNLQSIGLVNYKVRQAVTLTDLGIKIGHELAKRHKIFSVFFTDFLGVNKEKANEVACRIEHVIDDEIRERLSNFMNHLRKHDMNE